MLFRSPQLRVLYLSLNHISGTFPECVCRLTSLTALSLHNNQLTGPLPDSIGNLSQLRMLILSDNQLTGPIPDSLANLKENRTKLSLFGNNLSDEDKARVRELVGKEEGLDLTL